jgi:hypothetical protein
LPDRADIATAMSRSSLPVLLLGTIAWFVRAGHAVESAVPVALVSWGELDKNCSPRLGQTVRIQFQFHSRVATWNPYMTRFGPREYSAVRAWGDEQFPWIADEYDAPAARLFVRRGSDTERVFALARPSDRFDVDAVVREVFFDRPWVEVIAARPLAEVIGEGTVIHARRATELAEGGAWSLAEAEFERAITPTLPAHARAELERLRDAAHEAEIERTRPARGSARER